MMSDRSRGRDDKHPDDHVRRRPETVLARQREAFGGFNFSAALFGWLVAIAIGVLLTALLAAAGAKIGLTEVTIKQVEQNAGAIAIGGVIGLFVAAVVAYFGGGYVAGRLSRFDGARQGFGVWAVGIVSVLVLAGVGAIAGSEYNLFHQLNLPRIPVDEGTLTGKGEIALGVILVGSLLAAIGGGKAGELYHRRVDEVGFERDEDPASRRPRSKSTRARSAARTNR